MKPYRIALDALDRAGFRTSERGDEVLIQPLPTKHVWREEELILRSLVTDREGNVRSAGWPKFFNYGENAAHDEAFRQALERGDVEFTEKLDGSLLIADAREGGPALRTRGQASLGEFDAAVRALITRRYPDFWAMLSDPRDPLLGDLSLLFEFVSPAHTVVIRYDEPALYFLGAVRRSTLEPVWSEELAAAVTRRSGVEAAPLVELPAGLDTLVATIRAMSNQEGVVARFRDPAGRPWLLKLKASEYLRIHARRALLGERGALRMAFLLDLKDEAEVPAAFARLGLDHESSTYALGSLRPYFAARAAASDTLRRLQASLGADATRLDRRTFVEQVRSLQASDPALAAPFWFKVALKLHDGREDEAWLLVFAELTGEPAPTLRAWLRDREGALRQMLATRAASDEE